MKWSWKVGRIAGVDLRMHVTFLALIAWLVASYWLEGRSLSGVVAGVGFILALFACVVLHEMGQVLAARQFGIRTRDITLLPIGGLARLDHRWAGATGRVGNAPRSPVADSSETLEAVFRRLQEDGAGTIPVVSNCARVGLVAMESLREYLMIQAALKARGMRAGNIRHSVNSGAGDD
jgi:hypothetical protein